MIHYLPLREVFLIEQPYVRLLMKVIATVGCQSATRGVLIWQFCQDDEGHCFAYQESTGKLIDYDSTTEMNEGFNLLTKKYNYAQCSLLPA